jgi:hypothetical protein
MTPFRAYPQVGCTLEGGDSVLRVLFVIAWAHSLLLRSFLVKFFAWGILDAGIATHCLPELYAKRFVTRSLSSREQVLLSR